VKGLNLFLTKTLLKRNDLKILNFGVDRETINDDTGQGQLYMTPFTLHHNANQKSFLRFLQHWVDIYGEGGEISADRKILS